MNDMKRLIIVTLILFVSVKGNSTTIPLDSIRTNVIAFLNEVERYGHSFSDSDFFIRESKSKDLIEEDKEGVYYFYVWSDISYTHYVLVDKDSFQIINMEDPLDQNLLKFIAFFEKNNQYSKEDVLFYIKDFVTRYQRDKKRIRDHLIFPGKNTEK